MAHDPGQLTRRWFEEIWNQGKLETADALMGPGCVIHDPVVRQTPTSDPAEFRALAAALRQAVPDIHVAIEDILVVGDKSVARFVVTGTHTGEGLGVKPTHRHVRITGMAWGHWRDGKLLEGWNAFDLLGLYEQLGEFKRPS